MTIEELQQDIDRIHSEPRPRTTPEGNDREDAASTSVQATSKDQLNLVVSEDFFDTVEALSKQDTGTNAPAKSYKEKHNREENAIFA